MFVDARRSECAPTGTDRDLAAFEVAEKLLPFLVGRKTAFVAGAQCTASCQEGQVGLDRFVGIDGFGRVREKIHSDGTSRLTLFHCST
jgi:hypothetical protein